MMLMNEWIVYLSTLFSQSCMKEWKGKSYTGIGYLGFYFEIKIYSKSDKSS